MALFQPTPCSSAVSQSNCDCMHNDTRKPTGNSTSDEQEDENEEEEESLYSPIETTDLEEEEQEEETSTAHPHVSPSNPPVTATQQHSEPRLLAEQDQKFPCHNQKHWKSRLTTYRPLHPYGAPAREKRFACLLCPMRFRTTMHLIQHSRLHSQPKPFKCRYCGKEFRKNCSRKMHEMLHTGDYPFACDVCGKGIVSRGQLSIHARTHTTNISVDCDHCGKCFYDLTQLHEHRKTHTEKYPFTCNLCEQGNTDGCRIRKYYSAFVKPKPERTCFTQQITVITHTPWTAGDPPTLCRQCHK